jgi:hypothetical protein
LQHSPSLQIACDAAYARAWAALFLVVLLHSADDATVPASSSVRMHEALMRRCVRSRLLIGTSSHCSAIMGRGFVNNAHVFLRRVTLARRLFSPDEQRGFLLAQVFQALK